MTRFFHKEYLLFIFLLANLTAEYTLLMSISKMLFYATLAVSLIVCAMSFNSLVIDYKKCKHIYILGLIYVLYQFTIGLPTLSGKTALYLLSKCVVFATIVLCVNENFDFYFRKVIRPFSYVALFLLVLGYFIRPLDYAGHIAFGFANRNAGAIMATTAFAGILFTTEKIRYKDFFALLVLFGIILIGGSRNSLGMCFIFILVRYGISTRLVLISFVGLLLVFFVFPNIGISTEAFDRVNATLHKTLSLDREAQREAAIWMISAKPDTGWGFNAPMQGYAAELSKYGSHNGYLDHVIFMGLYFGIAWIFMLVLGVISRLKLYRLKDNFVNYHLAVIVAVLLGANQESFLVGVNLFTTNWFYMSFVVLGVYKYRYGSQHNYA